MTKEEREDRLHDRVDYLVDCPFTREFSQVKAEDFIRDAGGYIPCILCGGWNGFYVWL